MDFDKLAESYAEEIRLSRDLVKKLEKNRFDINLEAYEVYRALLSHYEKEEE